MKLEEENARIIAIVVQNRATSNLIEPAFYLIGKPLTSTLLASTFVFGFPLGGFELKWSLVATSLEGFSVTSHEKGYQRPPLSIYGNESEVSKRGWRTEGVGARRSLKGQRFGPLFCTFFPIPP